MQKGKKTFAYKYKNRHTLEKAFPVKTYKAAIYNGCNFIK